MKKTLKIVMLALVFAFTIFSSPVAEAATSKYNCSYEGHSCLGAYLVKCWYNNGTNPLWYSTGNDLGVFVKNQSYSGHTIYFYVTGPNGWRSATFTAQPGQARAENLTPTETIRNNFQSGYYVLHLECGANAVANDCTGQGEIITY